MKVRVNGTEREVADGATVAELLVSLDMPATGIAVAVDGEICNRGSHGRIVLTAGAEVEILTAVQGG